MPRFDWKDGLLIAAGFVACIATATLVERVLGIEINKELMQVLVGLTILGFPAARRRFFGEPDLPEPRRGFFPSVFSIVGLLATIFGMALLAIFGPRLFEARRTAQDYLTAPSEPLPALEGLEILKITDGEPDAEQAAREQQEIDKFETETRAFQQEALADWHRQEESHRETTRQLSALGLALVAFGALSAYVRYPKVVPASSSG